MDLAPLMQSTYFLLLLILLMGYLAVRTRGQAMAILRNGAVWLFLFLGVVVAYGVWSDIEFPSLPQQSVFAEEGRIEVPLSRDGHFHLVLRINGVAVPVIVDTGASDIVLSRKDAARVGLPVDTLPFSGRAQTANGIVSTARVRLDEVAIGPITDQFVPAIVNSGELQKSLLGMAYLKRFETIEMTRDRLVLTR